jgi:hypothetical protein
MPSNVKTTFNEIFVAFDAASTSIIKSERKRSQEKPHMKQFMRTWIGLLVATVAMVDQASADYWARVDHPSTYRELSQAIAYCRMLPRVNPDIGLFIDLVHGREIQKCMYSMGWIGVAK